VTAISFWSTLFYHFKSVDGKRESN
jgi:hypothetical protein